MTVIPHSAFFSSSLTKFRKSASESSESVKPAQLFAALFIRGRASNPGVPKEFSVRLLFGAMARWMASFLMSVFLISYCLLIDAEGRFFFPGASACVRIAAHSLARGGGGRGQRDNPPIFNPSLSRCHATNLAEFTSSRYETAHRLN